MHKISKWKFFLLVRKVKIQNVFFIENVDSVIEIMSTLLKKPSSAYCSGYFNLSLIRIQKNLYLVQRHLIAASFKHTWLDAYNIIRKDYSNLKPGSLYKVKRYLFRNTELLLLYNPIVSSTDLRSFIYPNKYIICPDTVNDRFTYIGVIKMSDVELANYLLQN